MRHLILIGLVLIFAPVAHASNCDDLLTKVRQSLAQNKFNTGRDFKNYASYLGPSFSRTVLSLSDESHWIDMGAGSARAMQEAVFLNFRRPKMTAISVTKPQEYERNISAFTQLMLGRFEYRDEKMIEEYPPGSIEKADLVTDVYGPFYYSPDPSLVLHTYVDLLKPGGVALIHYNTVLEGGKLRSLGGMTIENQNLVPLSLTEWIGDFRGVDVKVHRRYWEIRRIHQDFYIPRLQHYPDKAWIGHKFIYKK